MAIIAMPSSPVKVRFGMSIICRDSGATRRTTTMCLAMQRTAKACHIFVNVPFPLATCSRVIACRDRGATKVERDTGAEQ